MAKAAGLPVGFGTAHLALLERARLQAGQGLLVLGAGGGVGVAAVQVWHLLQNTVLPMMQLATRNSWGRCPDATVCLSSRVTLSSPNAMFLRASHI